MDVQAVGVGPVADWLTFFVAFFKELIAWLAATKLLGVSLIWLMVSASLFAFFVRVLLVRP